MKKIDDKKSKRDKLSIISEYRMELHKSLPINTEKQVMDTFPFKILSNKVKHLGINLTGRTSEIICQISEEKVEKYTRKHKNILHPWDGRMIIF